MVVRVLAFAKQEGLLKLATLVSEAPCASLQRVLDRGSLFKEGPDLCKAKPFGLRKSGIAPGAQSPRSNQILTAVWFLKRSRSPALSETVRQ
jgi:hypothetical protein